MKNSSQSPDVEEVAARIEEQLKESFAQDLKRLALLLASKRDGEILGSGEFQVRDLVHDMGARAIQVALEERKKGGT